MSKRWKQYLLRRLRNSESGQSILLLALGFIALAAFVGLVTDISIMFVRFATLRRAVDAAAISAAGQIREGTDYATVALAARQYITLHGLQPHRVWVETCETQIAEWRKNNPTADVTTMTKDDGDLCDFNNPRKLVKVTAQIDSQTTFLKLINIKDFVLTSSATSETAALDIALVLDTSDSMSEETKLDTYTKWGLQWNYGVVSGQSKSTLPRPTWFSTNLPYYCVYSNIDDILAGNAPATPNNWKWPGCCNDPSANAFVYLDTSTGEWKIYTDGTVGPGSIGAALIHPYADQDPSAVAPPFSVTGANGQYDAGEDGFKNTVPDGNYADLICEPFKQIKDAARNFISELDFIRGDRLALVSFNRLAQIVYPNNNKNNPPMITTEVDAMRTLDQYIGVWRNPTGKNAGCFAETQAVNDVRARSTAADADRKISDNTLANNRRPWSYETVAQCSNTDVGGGLRAANAALTDPTTIRRDAVWVAILLADGAANSSYNIDYSKAYNDTDPYSTDKVLYGDFGFCPWYTFCYYRPSSDPVTNQYWVDGAGADATLIDPEEIFTQWDTYTPSISFPQFRNVTAGTRNKVSYSECADSYNTVANKADLQRIKKFCNDGNPDSRHFCLKWSNKDDENGLPEGFTLDANGKPIGAFVPGSPCGVTGNYDADDYARDMADLAGLVEVAPGVPGNFIAMFTIGFGGDLLTDPTGASLLRYIADAGDNGQIDNNLEEDWRDNRIYNGNITGPNDPCYGAEFDADPTKWCGQYYYATNLLELDAVFEAIAGRLFTRIAR